MRSECYNIKYMDGEELEEQSIIGSIICEYKLELFDL